jgi:predicted sugar kinase
MLIPAYRYEISSSMCSNARIIAQKTEEAARRAKESQEMARKAEEEAKEVAQTAIYLKNDYDKWCGLGVYFSDM